MEVIKAIAVALLLLLMGDFVATFGYHVPGRFLNDFGGSASSAWQ